MYEEYWGLSMKPFEDGAQAGFVFRSMSYESALAKVLHVVGGGGDLVLLTAPAGCGKTMMASALKAELPASGNTVAYVAAPFDDEAELLSALLSAMGDDATARQGSGLLERLQKALADGIAAASASGAPMVAIIDEAHVLRSPNVLERIRMLLDLKAEGTRPLVLVLMGRPEMDTSIDGVADLVDRIAIRARIAPMGPDESKGYILHRLEAAGATRGIFTGSAADLIARTCDGIPRRLNRLCELCLAMGYSMGVERLGPDIVGEVIADLEV